MVTDWDEYTSEGLHWIHNHAWSYSVGKDSVGMGMIDTLIN